LDLLKLIIDEDFDLALGMSILKHFWASKHDGPLGIRNKFFIFILSFCMYYNPMLGKETLGSFI